MRILLIEDFPLIAMPYFENTVHDIVQFESWLKLFSAISLGELILENFDLILLDHFLDDNYEFDPNLEIFKELVLPKTKPDSFEGFSGRQFYRWFAENYPNMKNKVYGISNEPYQKNYLPEDHYLGKHLLLQTYSELLENLEMK